MSVACETESRSFVLLTLGARRYALPAEAVAELVAPGHLYTFPHTTPLLIGVLVRRGRIVPVCDLAQVLPGPQAYERKFFLIAKRKFGSASEWCAIPVSGECELINAEVLPPTEEHPAYVSRLLAFHDEVIEALDLEKIAAGSARMKPRDAATAGAEAQ